jgi:hypothetical protein
MNINEVSNPNIVLRLARKYYNKDVYLSTRKNKKYMIKNDYGEMVHFGDIRYEDFTYHKDITRQQNYLTRATNIKGDWANDMFSPNMLSIILLWDGINYLLQHGII